MDFVTATVVCVCLAVFWLAFYPGKRWKYRHIPGFFGWPLVGNLVEIDAHDAAVFIREGAKKFGPVFKLWWGARPCIVLADAEDVRRVSVKNYHRGDIASYFSSTTGYVHDVEAATVFFSAPSFLRARRRAFEASLLHPDRLQPYVGVMRQCAQGLVGLLRDAADSGSETEIGQAYGRLTMEVIGRCAYGVDLHLMEGGPEAAGVDSDAMAETGRRIVRATNALFTSMQMDKASPYIPLFQMFPEFIPLLRKLAAMLPDAKQRFSQGARGEMIAVSEELMRLWREASEQGKTAQKISATSFLAALMNDQKDSLNINKAAASAATSQGGDTPGPLLPQNTQGLSDLEIVAQLFMMMAAGYETTSATLSFITFFLASHAEAQGRVAKEAAAWLAARDADPAKAEDAMAVLNEHCPFIDAVIKETMRLYPIGPFLGRKLLEGDINVKGYHIPKGSMVFLATGTFHRDPAVWPRPDEWVPERFMPGAESEGLNPSSPHAFAPFGLGARLCPGWRFATLELKLALITVFSTYHVRLGPSQRLPLRAKTGFTHVPQDGVWVKLEHRR